jgi:methylated-DNA-[protein]-cysteine S-methyltransferase
MCADYRPGGENARVNLAAVQVATVAAPWGPIHLAATNAALVALDVFTTGEAFRARLERERPTQPPAGPLNRPGTVLDRAVAQVEEYLAGRRRRFDLPLALDMASAWDCAVYEGVRSIPWGAVAGYGEVARRIGRRGAARAVGGAVGRNPIGLVIPCHRVIAGDGTIGGYGGSWYGTREQLIEVKRQLLALEGVSLPTEARPA